MRIILLLVFTCLTMSLAKPDTPEEAYNKASKLLDLSRQDFRSALDNSTSKLISGLQDIQQTLKDLQTDNSRLLDQVNNQEQEIQDILAQGLPNDRRSLMFGKEALIYQDIFVPLFDNSISKIGNPSGWDQSSYSSNLWNGKKIIAIGNNYAANGNGLKVVVPGEYDLLWIRVNDPLVTVKVTPINFSYEDKYSCGKRGLNEVSPDGTVKDSHNYYHQWCPIPVRRTEDGDVILVIHSFINTQVWISGIAFGKNIWNHAKNSAVAYHWKVNGGSDVNWGTDNWNTDILVLIPPGRVNELIVPVVPNGKDKLFYLLEHNSNWSGVMHRSITANDVEIERLRSTYINPFSLHANGKAFMRYLAAKIPKELIGPNDHFVSIKINMMDQDLDIKIREAGTHDYN